MKALIVTGGEGPSPELLRRLAARADLVIAADSGLDAARAAGVVPRLVVGDFDSLQERSSLDLYEKEDIFEYSADKDETDTELALRLARGRGAVEVALAGGGKGRLDHLLGLYSLFMRAGCPDEWHTGSESAFRLRPGESGRFAPGEGATVSVFPLAPACRGMSSQGLQWPLEGLVWGPGQFGLSNLAVSGEIGVRAGDAALLVVLPSGTQRLA